MLRCLRIASAHHLITESDSNTFALDCDNERTLVFIFIIENDEWIT